MCHMRHVPTPTADTQTPPRLITKVDMSAIRDVIRWVRAEYLETRWRIVNRRILFRVNNSADSRETSDHSTAQVKQFEDPAREREVLASGQPERRRYRSDTELRKERAQWERQWNERQHDDGPT